jgi:hypothetical protein
MTKSAIGAGGVLLLSALLLPAAAVAASDDSWAFGAAIYGWFPDISGRTSILEDGDGAEFEIEIGDILKNLEFTFQGGFDARRGRFGVVTDLIYMSIGKSDSAFGEGTVGDTQIPVDVAADIEFDMKSWIWTTAGYYRAVAEEVRTFDILAGFRYIDVEQTLDWSLSGNIGQIPRPGREGSGEAGLTNWDFIVGLRGRFAFGQNNAWYVPYYLDLGTGDSDFTWQAAAGVGYAFRWGELTAVWRYLEYDLPSDKAIADVNFNGPAVGAVFRW